MISSKLSLLAPRLHKQKEISIYPNPFLGNEFTISRINKIEETYEVYSTHGLLLSNGVLKSNKQNIIVTSDYQGLLFLKLTNLEGESEIYKIIKAN